MDKINEADSVIFQTEKQLKEIGDKMPADKKSQIEAELEKLKEAHKAQDVAAIDASLTALNGIMQQMSQEMYANAGADAGAQPGPDMGAQGGASDQGTKSDDHVTDADFEEVK